MASSVKHRTPALQKSDPVTQGAAFKEHQTRVLTQLDCMHAIEQHHIQQLAELAVVRSFPMGATIISEHTAYSFLYIILHGSICLRLHDRAGREVLIGYLNRGDCFGEGALFGDQFRSAAAQAETSCYVIQVPISDLNALLPQAPELESMLRGIYRHRLVASTLARVPLFNQLLPLTRVEIGEMLEQCSYERDSYILREGERSNAFYMIESGQVVVESQGQALAHLDEGDFFGEMALLSDGPHNADVRTLTPTQVLMLPALAFRNLLEHYPGLAEKLREVVEARRKSGSIMQHDPLRSERLALALDNGALRGRHVMVRDAHLCPSTCHACMDACASRFGRARLNTRGIQIGDLAIVDVCRQCRFGAECVEACPENALQWNEHGALVVVASKCTGCGQCVQMCPYDAIQLSPQVDAHSSPMWALWRHLQQLRRPHISLEPLVARHLADKCDLCAGYSDMACMRACPTGALRLISIDELL